MSPYQKSKNTAQRGGVLLFVGIGYFVPVCSFLDDPALFLRQTKNPVSAGGNPDLSRGSGYIQLDLIGKIIKLNPANRSDAFYKVAFLIGVGSEIIIREVLKTDSLAYGIYGAFLPEVWASA